MLAKKEYVEFLISTQKNYTGSYLAEHLDGVSHDTVTDFLEKSRLSAHNLWELMRQKLQNTPESFLILDDTVLDKRYSRAIDLVKVQYSGNEHDLVRGIGVVNLVHSSGKDGDYYPIDYRIYAPEYDGKTKNEHFREMLEQALVQKKITAKTILFDAWYASVDNLKYIHRHQLIFYTTLKENRLVSRDKEHGYIHLQAIQWSDTDIQNGIWIKLKEVPFKVRLFKLVAQNGDIDWVITNDPDVHVTMQVVQDACDVRWQIEQLHRELKQLTGIAKCQCQHARSQKNHIACCYHAWISIKIKAKELGKTLYCVKSELLATYMRTELRNPRIRAYNLA